MRILAIVVAFVVSGYAGFADYAHSAGRGPVTQTQAPSPKPLDVTGKWTMSFETPMGTSTPALEFKQDGEKITGNYTGRYGKFPFEGTLKGKAIQFAFTMNAEGTPAEMTFSGQVAADGLTMGGQATLGEMGDTQWSAKKNPDK